jgi:branched-chain amino acid transport system permease protein
MQIWLNYLDQILIAAALGLSLNLLLGHAGQVSVAHAAFGAIGGYTMGYVVTTYNWSLIWTILLGVAFSFVVGGLLALVAMRLSVEYLILLTLAFGNVLIGVISAIPALGGTYGIIQIDSEPHTLNIFGLSMDRPGDWVIPLLVVVIITYAICWRMGESAYGRVLKGIREDPVATRSLGKNTFKVQIMVFAITSALAGLAGAMNAAWLAVSTPNVFGFNFSLTVVAIVIFGGMANLKGTLVGAFILTALKPFLERTVKIDPAQAFLIQILVYGVLLVILVMVRPAGLMPEGRTFISFVRRGNSGERTEMSAKTAALVEPEFAVRSTAGAIDQSARHAKWEQAEVVLEARGISKSFGGIVAAEDLDFVLKKGTITALVGPNGAGKTTVFNLLTGNIIPDRGTVHLRGKDITGRSLDAAARQGLVRSFQDVRLFQRLSCLDNVLFGVQEQAGEKLPTLFARPATVARSNAAAHEKAMEWLTFVGMQDFANVPAGALSYGQTKLISLARVLSTEAEVLLLDEPASGIDTKWVDNMLDLVLAIAAKGRTVAIVEHNLRVVTELADHAYFMELGRITAEGTVDELTSSPRLAAAYFGTVA